ncbi:hypothetical protein P175DRAFT_0555684 [Aspergillus ochraceoroseus IBT 24754]|uniref:BZIP domain-containing protein n=3 Tax=Aspergillus subgen. Nidulantes TaxID=2720870 RepID=A0A0F8UEM1_9EURO|nr:uncharacterized protein P175DRAFT_0555684 [Aspergillus ochraceoroseus IBT 24754]KKK15784.1 hypothetical protein AOCH_005167 [Aspergillus ochraceoroseus]KKK18028.1 hypothetical protein ARAM_000752 [Aspergillus rambellii]PTU23023.1 hypothetical protein P175DRAFT_0555684 [Aspergillus ochraceoroseus IBT 24754]
MNPPSSHHYKLNNQFYFLDWDTLPISFPIPTLEWNQASPSTMMLPVSGEDKENVEEGLMIPPFIHDHSTFVEHPQQATNIETYECSPPCSPGTVQKDNSEEEARLRDKRRRNKLAARKLRKKQLDRVVELEAQLGKVTQERDELRVQVAKWEGEAKALREINALSIPRYTE